MTMNAFHAQMRICRDINGQKLTIVQSKLHCFFVFYLKKRENQRKINVFLFIFFIFIYKFIYKYEREFILGQVMRNQEIKAE